MAGPIGSALTENGSGLRVDIIEANNSSSNGQFLAVTEGVGHVLEDFPMIQDHGLLQAPISDEHMCEQDKTLGEVSTPLNPPTVSQ